MVGVLFGPYLLVGLLAALLLFWWALVRDGSSKSGTWTPFEFRSSEDFHKTFGDKPPY